VCSQSMRTPTGRYFTTTINGLLRQVGWLTFSTVRATLSAASDGDMAGKQPPAMVPQAGATRAHGRCEGSVSDKRQDLVLHALYQSV
jgi:hypothetical protein